jgi:hypothetical protein
MREAYYVRITHTTKNIPKTSLYRSDLSPTAHLLSLSLSLHFFTSQAMVQPCTGAYSMDSLPPSSDSVERPMLDTRCPPPPPPPLVCSAGGEDEDEEEAEFRLRLRLRLGEGQGLGSRPR